MNKAIDVARHLLTLVDEEAGDLLSHLKLQKLLYYSQGFTLALLDRPLFEEKVVAWQHGPVVPAVWEEFKQYGKKPLPKPVDFDSSILSADARHIVDEVYLVYGQYSASKLRNMTHEEAPWLQTPGNEEIGRAAMKIFFQKNAACKRTPQTPAYSGRWVPVTRKVIGKVLDMGGGEPFIYLLAKNMQTELEIHADEKMLAEGKNNYLYKNVVATVRAEEHLDTGELRNLHLLSLDDHSPAVESHAFREMCKAGAIAWKGVTDASEWVREHRGA